MSLASEEDEPVRYILVPFNDYGSIGFLIQMSCSMPASRLHLTLSQGWAGMVAKHLKQFQQRSEVTDDFHKR